MKDRYNTNLAAEFHVMSVLHRLGADASLSLGNKKSVDIAVIRGKGEALTIDVKGLAGKSGWPVDNFRGGGKRHFLALVCYLGKIDQPGNAPEVYIVPAGAVRRLTYCSPTGRKLINYYKMRNTGEEFLNNWSQLTG